MLLVSILVLSVAIARTHQRTIPPNNDCSFHSSNYSVSWAYDELSNDISFKLTSRSAFTNFYTVIGFGDEKPEDVIAVYVRSLQIGLIDGHLADDGAIESDEKTNVQALQFDLQDGVLTAQFARPVETLDSEDSDLKSCVTFFFLTEPREIITGAPLELGNENSLQKVRVCDIAATCATKIHDDVLVKRQEDGGVAPICATGPANQKNRIEWKVDGDLIRFSVFQNAKKGRWWTAIGAGESMSDLNMILLFAENGRLKSQGIYRTEGIMKPVTAQFEGIELKKDLALVTNGKAHFDVSIEKKFFLDRANEQGCFTMQVAILAGQYQANTYNIQKHQNTPQAVQVCNIDACLASIDPQNEIVEETSNRTLVKGDGEIPEASGATEPTKVAPNNDAEGSGLSAEPKIENQEPQSTAHTAEIADEKPLTGDGASDAPSIFTSSSSSTTTPVAASINPVSITPEKNHALAVETPSTKGVQAGEEKNDETTGKVDDAPEKTENNTENLDNRDKNGCGAQHEDLKICQSYFDEYLGKVNEWSVRHNMTITSHMWKACTLLSQVQHVTTMCCTIFRTTCATYLSL